MLQLGHCFVYSATSIKVCVLTCYEREQLAATHSTFSAWTTVVAVVASWYHQRHAEIDNVRLGAVTLARRMENTLHYQLAICTSQNNLMIHTHRLCIAKVSGNF